MKKRFLGLLLLPLMVGACSVQSLSISIPDYSYDTHTISHARKTGEINDFNLLGPINSLVVEGKYTFTWEECANADYFVLEMATTETFITNDNEEVYVKESNISNNRFDLNYSLPKKDRTYYWRVTAINQTNRKVSNAVDTFYYKAPNDGEIPIKIEDEQDWVLHKEGSYADISIDRTNFFGNVQDSLAIVFDKEHTSQGIAKSDGWIVVTKNEDRELYGTDAFYFNFYYSGHDATVLVRVLDYDGEYWHKQVQIANNSKQTVIVKYSDFTLRTAGTNIYNRAFDWEHIRYFEIVFERTFGDGICLFSNIKAVKFDNYKNMFMEKMDFKSTDMKDWTYENYNFPKEISEDGNEITLSYTPYNETDNPTGMKQGYGFQNANVYKFFVEGDALRMDVKYTGSTASANFYFRVLEEDGDRWQFKTPLSYFIKDEYKELIIPLKAFQRTDYMSGDGAKQFYYIQKFNFGLAENWAKGTLSIKDIEVISIASLFPDPDPDNDEIDSPIVKDIGVARRTVPANGMIEDYENYNIYTEMYYYWEQSFVNKDESMKLDNIHRVVGNGNKYCGEFDYKADMEMAQYQLYLDTNLVTEKNAFSLWLKDASAKFAGDAEVAYLDEDNIKAEMTIQLTMDSGEWYRYIIDGVEKEWTNYTLAFDDMMVKDEETGDVIHNGWFIENIKSLIDDPQPLASDHIIHIGFGFKYFYYDQAGKAHPTYAIANPVYLDNICFTNATETSVVEIPSTLKVDTDNPDRITVETMERYQNEDEMFDFWSYGNSQEYNQISLSDEVSSKGESHSIKMHYKGDSESVSYVRATQFARNVTATGVCLDIKGDSAATVYVNLNWRVSSSSLLKMRYTIRMQNSIWMHYEIGFDLFEDINNSENTIASDDAKNIESISFGIVNKNDKDKNESDIYVDNIRLLKNIEYDTYTRKTIS